MQDKETEELKSAGLAGRYGHRKFFMPCCYASGPRIFVATVSYQGQESLTKSQALGYLEWLDSGNDGSYWEFQKTEAGQALGHPGYKLRR